MKKKLLILLILTFFLGGCTQNNSSDLTYFSEGLKNLERVEYSDALVNFKKSINQNPSHTESYEYASGILLGKKQYGEAEILLKSGVEFVEDKSSILTLLGRSMYSQSNFDEAESYFNNAYKINKNNNEALLGLVTSKAAQEKFSEINDIFNSYSGGDLSSDLKLLHVFINFDEKSKINTLIEQYKNSISEEVYAEIKRVNEIEDEPVAKNMEISRLIINNGFPAFALKYINVAITTNEFYEGGYLFKAIVQSEIGKLDEALTNISSAIEINPNLAENYQYQGRIFMLKKDYKNAEKSFTQAINKESSSRILFDYYELLAISDPEDKIISVLTDLKDLEPTNIEYSLLLAEQYCIKDEYLTELDQLMLVIASFESKDKEINEKIKILNSCLLYKEGKEDIAIKDINEVLLINKNQILGYYIEALIAYNNSNSQFEVIKSRIIDSDLTGYYTLLIQDLDA